MNPALSPNDELQIDDRPVDELDIDHMSSLGDDDSDVQLDDIKWNDMQSSYDSEEHKGVQENLKSAPLS